MINQLSIKNYTIGFILLYISIFILSGFYAYKDINSINQKLITANKTGGKNELINAYKTLIRQHQEITHKFADWDEVHQQLDNMEFYSFWYIHRLNNANILPEYYQEVALYNKDGTILFKLKSTTLPETIPLKNLNPFFIIEDSIAYLMQTVPINDRDNKHKIRGYVMTKSRVFGSLLKIQQFNFVEVESIHVNVDRQDHIAVDDFINYLNYKIKINDDIKIFIDFLKWSIIRNLLIFIAFAGLFYYVISIFLSRPIIEISNYIDHLDGEPDLNKVFNSGYQFHIDELEKVRHSLVQYHNKLKHVHLNLDVKNKELWQMAHKDALTGVYNRRAFEKHLKQIKDIFSNSRQKIAILLFDINHFKSINDTYGHQVGDKVLKAIASTINICLRKSEKLYRIGGDEFATILQIESPDDALYVAERCVHSIKSINLNNLNIKEPVVTSIGISHNICKDPVSINDLLWQADVAVYEAKKPGHSHIVFYCKAIDKASDSILSSKINTLVYDALETGNGIIMFYQPIINVTDNSVDYYEALLRIKKEDEIIQPQSIFELIEARKLEFELDNTIFKAIEQDLKDGVIPQHTGVSINVSGPSIINKQILDILSLFVPYLENYKIVLEITETSLITNIDQATENIRRLRELGFLIALDDFGSGYSSISYLSSMPVDIVKFDISLIQQLSDKKQYSIIYHLASMINETGHKLVAEGIETETMKNTIKKMKFHYAQGYLFGKPTHRPS